MNTFDRFAIVQAYYLFYAMFLYVPHPRFKWQTYRSLPNFSPSLTIRRATHDRTNRPRNKYYPLTYATALPKNDDYQSTRDAYARVVRLARRQLRQARSTATLQERTTMTITIAGAKQAPTWVTMQDMIRQALNSEKGVLTRIARTDRNCSYRDAGEYHLEFVPLPTGDMVSIVLVVKG